MLDVLSTLDIEVFFQYLNSGGLLAFFVFLGYAGYKRWWFFGYVSRDYEERLTKMEKERDDWRDLALHGTSLAEQTVDLFRRSRRAKEGD